MSENIRNFRALRLKQYISSTVFFGTRSSFTNIELWFVFIKDRIVVNACNLQQNIRPKYHSLIHQGFAKAFERITKKFGTQLSLGRSLRNDFENVIQVCDPDP